MQGWGNKQRGFTLVELIIVIVIIVIISLIVVVSYRAVVINANNTAVQTDLNKLADRIKLKTLDDGIVPDGGGTSADTGSPTTFPGITFQPAVESYDTSVANLYYCAGAINGVKEFSLVAQALSGNAYVYDSFGGIRDLTEYTLSVANNGIALCSAIGYTSPFTWSFGYAPGTGGEWQSWAQ